MISTTNPRSTYNNKILIPSCLPSFIKEENNDILTINKIIAKMAIPPIASNLELLPNRRTTNSFDYTW